MQISMGSTQGRGEFTPLHYDIRGMHSPIQVLVAGSDPIQWAHGDVGLKPSAAARPEETINVIPKLLKVRECTYTQGKDLDGEDKEAVAGNVNSNIHTHTHRARTSTGGTRRQRRAT